MRFEAALPSVPVASPPSVRRSAPSIPAVDPALSPAAPIDPVGAGGAGVLVA